MQYKYKETLRGIEHRKNVAEKKKMRASQRAAEYRTMHNMKKENKNGQ